MCFVHPIYRFRFLVTFGNKVMKILRILCLHFARQDVNKEYVIFFYILQGKMDKAEKNRKENHTTKVTKIPKTKRQKYGMNETLALIK